MDKKEWAMYKSALKALDQGPKAIKVAKATYDGASNYMKQHEKDWSENGRRDFYAAAREKRDAAIQAECKKMEAAIGTLRLYRSYPNEVVDLNSTQLQNALSIVNLMGKKLPPAQQLSILEAFRGQPATLEFLSQVYKQNGLFYGDYAAEMAKPLSEDAINEMEANIFRTEYSGEWDAGKVYWVEHEFERTGARLGFDVQTVDPYVEALRSMKENAKNQDEARAVSNALFKIMNAGEFGLTDSDKEQIMNETYIAMASATEDRERREIATEAHTYRSLEELEQQIAAGENGGNEKV